MALRMTAVSGVPIKPFSDRVSCLTIGTTLLIRTNSSVLISVLRILRAIDFEMVGSSAADLLVSGAQGMISCSSASLSPTSGERAIHPTSQHASLAAARTPAR